MKRARIWPSVVILLIAACGSTSDDDSTVSVSRDAGTDAGGSASDAAPSPPTGPRLLRCTGSEYEKAPSGADCDPTRIERSGSFEAPCFGPTEGMGCDRLEIAAPEGGESALPEGFVCASPSQGISMCRWKFDNDAGGATFGVLDAAALEAACAATRVFPTLSVVCAVHGS